MKSREEELAARLKGYLDRSAAELRPGLAYRLQQARAQALSRLAENAQEAVSGGLVGAHGLVGAGAGGGDVRAQSGQRPFLAQGRLWLAVGVVALAVLGWQQWTAWQEIDELEAIDAEILTSDLPVGALADRGFRLFLEVAPPPMPEPVDPEDAAAGEAAPASVDAAPADAVPAEGRQGDAPAGAPVPRSRAPFIDQRVA
ncbi:MAG: DUF3619 family protein [Burkholderiales bacterium]|nr:DUF3619 family protein [Burkholderiales bacterium]